MIDMSTFKRKLEIAFKDPWALARLLMYKTAKLWSDKIFLRIIYYINTHKRLNLDNPKSFNEKLQWLKLYNRKPEYIIMADKVKAKEWVAERIGEEYIIPTLGVWDDPDDINFDALPNQFVLKCNHNSGLGMYICHDKNKMDVEGVKKKLRKGLEDNYYLYGREWPYKDIPRKILAEKFMADESGDGDLKDYKLMCFDGKVFCSFVCSDRSNGKGLKVTFFDRDWKKMPFERHYPAATDTIPKPSQYQEMIHLSELLSAKIPFVRCDFYEINGHLYFGELTFFPGAGFEEFTPETWDELLGELIKIPD